MRVLRAVVFDLDDTLYPERSYAVSGFAAVARWVETALGIPVDSARDELIALLNGGVRGRVFDEWLIRRGIEAAPGTVAEMVRVFRDHAPKISLYPEADALLRALGPRFRLGLLTDGYLEVQRKKVNALGLRDRFDGIVLSDQWGRESWKPNPRCYQEIARILSVATNEAVYVADNPAKDFLGARRAGMSSIRVRREGTLHWDVDARGEGAPDIEIGALEDVEEAIERLATALSERP